MSGPDAGNPAGGDPARSANGADPGRSPAQPAGPPGGAQPPPGGAGAGQGQPAAGGIRNPPPGGKPAPDVGWNRQPSPPKANPVDAAGPKLTDHDDAGQRDEVAKARSEFGGPGTVFGGFVAGNQTNNHFEYFGGRNDVKIGSYALPPEEIDRPFVRGAGYPGVVDAVTSHSVVVVQARPGSGRTSVLIRAFSEILPAGWRIRRIAKETDLETLSIDGPLERSFLLFDDAPDTTVARIENFTFGRLASELVTRGARLGLTVGPDVTVRPQEGLSVVPLGSRPDPRAVFDKHLAARLREVPAVRAALLARADVRDLLIERLVGSAPLEEVAWLAEAFAKAARDDVATAAPAVRSWLDGRALDECIPWFRSLPDLRAHCMAIALAVLNGLARETVSSAADRLDGLIAPKPEKPEAGMQVDPFTSGGVDSLTLLKARTSIGTMQTVQGELPVIELSYQESRFCGWVLRHVWQEHDLARPHLVTWLRELGGNGNAGVRARTAAAVGMLAGESFNFLCSQIIGHWARDEDAAVRYSAAIALGEAGATDQVRGVVDALVRDWIKDPTEPALQATAARTFGTAVGLVRPSNALRQLSVLAEADNVEVTIAVAHSIGDLLMEGTSALAGRVLTEVTSWVAGPSRERRLAGRLAFLLLTSLRGVPDAVREHPTAPDQLPSLLVIAMYDGRFVEPLAALFRDGLNSADLNIWISRALTEWAGLVDREPAVRTALINLLNRVATDRRTATILVRLAVRWRSETGSAHQTAEELLAKTGVNAYG